MAAGIGLLGRDEDSSKGARRAGDPSLERDITRLVDSFHRSLPGTFSPFARLKKKRKKNRYVLRLRIERSFVFYIVPQYETDLFASETVM